MIRTATIATALTAIILSSAACNTVQGLGRDIESVGQKGEEVISHAPADDRAVQDAR
jgi:predicted small secreted protein